MATRYSYPINLHNEREGGFWVSFPDFDEALTGGDTLAEAITEASDCLEEALAGRIARREDIPRPSPARGRPAAVPGTVLAAKAALYEALREQRLSNSAFAVAMGIQEARFAACSIPATSPRSAGSRKPWPALGSAWWSQWKKSLDCGAAETAVSVAHEQWPVGRVVPFVEPGAEYRRPYQVNRSGAARSASICSRSR